MVVVVSERMKRRSYRTADDVAAELALPVLAVVPAMLTAWERRRRWRRRLALVLAVVTSVAACGAVVAWVVVG